MTLGFLVLLMLIIDYLQKCPSVWSRSHYVAEVVFELLGTPSLSLWSIGIADVSILVKDMLFGRALPH